MNICEANSTVRSPNALETLRAVEHATELEELMDYK